MNTPLKVALIGYGKMGKTLHALCPQYNAQAHTIIDKPLSADKLKQALQGAEVAIEFTRPDAAFDNVCVALHLNLPILCGTTGWDAQMEAAKSLCTQLNGTLLIAQNCSWGMNLFMMIHRYTAQLMQSQKNYTARLREMHHRHKKDAPSGTALRLADTLIHYSSYTHWTLDPNPNPHHLPIQSIREGDIIGEHSIHYTSEEDTITLGHKAHNRESFAAGALKAAHYLHLKKGIYTMEDVISEQLPPISL